MVHVCIDAVRACVHRCCVYAPVEFTSHLTPHGVCFWRLPRLSSSFLTSSGHLVHMIWYADLLMAKHHLGTLMTIGSRLLCVTYLCCPSGDRPHGHLLFVLSVARWRMPA